MKNADMPAMALSGEAYADASGHNGKGSYELGMGLTKREMFAMHAMQGLLSCDNAASVPLPPSYINGIRNDSYAIADAMLAE